MTASLSTAWLFPGQGSQTVGMGRELCDADDRAAAILERAADISGHPLKKYCWEGPPSTLARTDVLQPALTAVMLGAAHYLLDRGHTPDVTAGHSLGEFAALHVAGVLDLDDTLQLVTERGRVMHDTAEANEGSMIASLKLDASTVRSVVDDVQDAGVVDVANYNAPGQVVLSGEPDALEEAANRLASHGANIRFLDVSGAWHSRLMAPAVDAFADALDAATFSAPELPVLANATGEPEDDPAALRQHLLDQLTTPVHWTKTIRWMIDHGATRFVEVGPGKVLRGLMRYIWTDYDAYAVFSMNEPHHADRLDAERSAA